MKKIIHSNTAVIAATFLAPPIAGLLGFCPEDPAIGVLSMELGFAAIWLVFLLWALPGIIATKRQHQNANFIWLVTVFLGWSGFGWIAALIWACSADTAAWGAARGS